MNTLLILRAIHVFGAILWVGGIVTVAMVAVGLRERAVPDGATVLRGTLARVVNPGMLLAFVGGLAMLIPNFTALYARAGWMHAKLLCILIAAGLTGAITGTLRKAASGEKELEVKRLRAMGVAVMTLGFLIVVLAIVQPF